MNPPLILSSPRRVQAPKVRLQQLFEQAQSASIAGRQTEAEKLCLQILAIDVRHAKTLHLLGLVGFRTDRHELAIRMIQRAIAVDDKNSLYYCNLGIAQQAQQDFNGAAASFRRALKLRPSYAEAHSNLGFTLQTLGELDQAIQSYQRALKLVPSFVEAHYNLGNAFKDQGRFDEAVACYKTALRLRPNFADVYSNLGLAYKEMDRIDESIECLEKARNLNPNLGAAHSNLGNVLMRMDRIREAIACYERGVQIQPDNFNSRWNLALCQLLVGNMRDGWKNHEARSGIENIAPRVFPRPIWRGESLEGKRILLHAEQGFGDSLQFLRYVPMVLAAGGSIILDLPRSLHSLAAELPGDITINMCDRPHIFDVHCPLMSLPLAFSTTLETIPAQVPYLSIPDAAMRAADARSWPTDGLRVGLVWAGNPKHLNDHNRSMSLSLMEPLFSMPGAHFYSLQMGPAAEQITELQAPLIDLTANIGDYADTAALIAHLDLLIAVDTSVVHLAGALAKPAWVLVPTAPDWRWLQDRDDSPWYPTVRVFRQSTRGDWSFVVEQVRAALCALVEQKSRA